MILDVLQVSPARTSVLEEAGGFGMLPDTGGGDFLQLLKGNPTGFQPTRDIITYANDRPYASRSEERTVPADTIRPDDQAAKEADRESDRESDREAAANRNQIDLRAVEELLQRRDDQVRRAKAADRRAADAHSDGVKGKGRGDALGNGDANPASEASPDSGRIDLEGLAQLTGDAGGAKAQAAADAKQKHASGQTAQSAESTQHIRLHEAKSGKADAASQAAGDEEGHSGLQKKLASADHKKLDAHEARKQTAEKTARLVETRSATDESVDRAALEALQDGVQKSAEATRNSDTRIEQPRSAGAARQAQDVERSESQSSGARRTMVQVVDLRTADQPSRLEKLRADIREAAVQGRTRGNSAASGAAGGRDTSAGGGNAGGENGQGGFHSGQDNSGRSGIHGDLMDRFFRGGSSASSDSSSNSFASMFQRFGQNPAASLSADAAQMLNSKFQEHLNADIVRQARFVLRDGEAGEIRLRLRPESLGNVQIQLDVKDNVIAARFLVENSSVRQIVEQQLAQLTQAFEDAGLELGSMEVSVGNQDFPEGSEESAEGSPLRSTRSDEQQTEALAESVRDVTMLGSGDQLINIMA